MLYRIIVAGASVLVLAGCEQLGVQQRSLAGPTAPTSMSATTAGRPAQKPDVPFSGVVTGDAAFDFANPRGCPPGFTTITDAKGTASHLGVTSWHSEHCVAFGPDGISMAGDLVLTAANGDQLYATYTATAGALPNVGDPILITGTILFAGGTGRFESAAGTAQMTAEVIWEGEGDFSSPGRWEWTGSIRY